LLAHCSYGNYQLAFVCFLSLQEALRSF
jgi:hypothetical protein